MKTFTCVRTLFESLFWDDCRFEFLLVVCLVDDSWREFGNPSSERVLYSYPKLLTPLSLALTLTLSHSHSLSLSLSLSPSLSLSSPLLSLLSSSHTKLIHNSYHVSIPHTDWWSDRDNVFRSSQSGRNGRVASCIQAWWVLEHNDQRLDL